MRRCASRTAARRPPLPCRPIEVLRDFVGGAGDGRFTRPGSEVMVGVDTRHIALASAAQRLLDIADADAVDYPPPSGRTARPQMIARTIICTAIAGLVAKAVPVGTCAAAIRTGSLVHALGSSTPWARRRLGQVQSTLDERVAAARHIGGEHLDLAVRDLARRAGVLTADAARGLALLQETGLVDVATRSCANNPRIRASTSDSDEAQSPNVVSIDATAIKRLSPRFEVVRPIVL